MKSVLFASVISAAGASRTTSTSFESFLKAHERVYKIGSEEYEMRRSLYEKRLLEVQTQNSEKGRLWTAGISKLSDWTKGELMALRGYDGSAKPASSGRSLRRHTFIQKDASDDADLPNDKLWTGLSASRHIRDQGNCGSCWAIASATVLEAHAEIAGKPRTFSPQQIVECTPNPKHCGGDGGCEGATAELAMDYVLKNGLKEESEMPYTGQDAACAGTDDKLAMAQIFGTAGNGGASFGMTGWETLPKNEYLPLVRALANQGPVAVSVAADAWMNYDHGVFNSCGKDAVIDHSVTAIGYGVDDGVKYWTIQNSWGPDWGEAGHIRLERHDSERDGQYCGMNNDPQKGVACKGETDAVPVCGMCGVLFDSVVPQFQA